MKDLRVFLHWRNGKDVDISPQHRMFCNVWRQFLVIKTESATASCECEGQGCCSYPVVHKTPPPPPHILKNYEAQHVINAEFEALIQDNFVLTYMPFKKKIGIHLIYNVVLASRVQQSGSVLYIYIYIYSFSDFFPIIGYYKILNIVSSAMQ